MDKRKKAILALADGTIFEGLSFGATGEVSGEIVFNTSLTGYQEILTDPSYRGQIVNMTYTQIGNYGFNVEDVESWRPWVEGFIAREPCPEPSNWRSIDSIDSYLKRHSIVGIHGIDTRALTIHIRDNGAMEGVISTIEPDASVLVSKAAARPGLLGQDLAKEVTCSEPYIWMENLWKLEEGHTLVSTEECCGTASNKTGKRLSVVAYDFGIKRNISRCLTSLGCEVTVVPADTPAETVLKMDPDGIFLSNGPGDPAAVTYGIEAVRELIGKKPIFGICLGHQILSLALGAKSFKLKFGHRGGNQPVMDNSTGKVEITSQNHGFAIDMDSVKDQAVLTHVNLNDNTVEGIADPERRFFSVQYHPEASPGPHDASYLFERFVDMMRK